MTDYPTITLETILDEVGITVFNRWQIEADRGFRSSEYADKGAYAKHAFEYEFIRKKYNSLKESQKPYQGQDD